MQFASPSALGAKAAGQATFASPAGGARFASASPVAAAAASASSASASKYARENIPLRDYGSGASSTSDAAGNSAHVHFADESGSGSGSGSRSAQVSDRHGHAHMRDVLSPSGTLPPFYPGLLSPVGANGNAGSGALLSPSATFAKGGGPRLEIVSPGVINPHQLISNAQLQSPQPNARQQLQQQQQPAFGSPLMSPLAVAVPVSVSAAPPAQPFAAARAATLKNAEGRQQQHGNQFRTPVKGTGSGRHLVGTPDPNNVAINKQQPQQLSFTSPVLTSNSSSSGAGGNDAAWQTYQTVLGVLLDDMLQPQQQSAHQQHSAAGLAGAASSLYSNAAAIPSSAPPGYAGYESRSSTAVAAASLQDNQSASQPSAPSLFDLIMQQQQQDVDGGGGAIGTSSAAAVPGANSDALASAARDYVQTPAGPLPLFRSPQPVVHQQHSSNTPAKVASSASASGAASSDAPPPQRRSPFLLAVALYSFSGIDDQGELSFQKGKEIMVYKWEHSQWWYGQISGSSSRQRGWFPKSYVKLLQELPAPWSDPVGRVPTTTAQVQQSGGASSSAASGVNSFAGVTASSSATAGHRHDGGGGLGNLLTAAGNNTVLSTAVSSAGFGRLHTGAAGDGTLNGPADYSRDSAGDTGTGSGGSSGSGRCEHCGGHGSAGSEGSGSRGTSDGNSRGADTSNNTKGTDSFATGSHHQHEECEQCRHTSGTGASRRHQRRKSQVEVIAEQLADVFVGDSEGADDDGEGDNADSAVDADGGDSDGAATRGAADRRAGASSAPAGNSSGGGGVEGRDTRVVAGRSTDSSDSYDTLGDGDVDSILGSERGDSSATTTRASAEAKQHPSSTPATGAALQVGSGNGAPLDASVVTPRTSAGWAGLPTVLQSIGEDSEFLEDDEEDDEDEDGDDGGAGDGDGRASSSASGKTSRMGSGGSSRHRGMQAAAAEAEAALASALEAAVISASRRGSMAMLPGSTASAMSSPAKGSGDDAPSIFFGGAHMTAEMVQRILDASREDIPPPPSAVEFSAATGATSLPSSSSASSSAVSVGADAQQLLQHGQADGASTGLLPRGDSFAGAAPPVTLAYGSNAGAAAAVPASAVADAATVAAITSLLYNLHSMGLLASTSRAVQHRSSSSISTGPAQPQLQHQQQVPLLTSLSFAQLPVAAASDNDTVAAGAASSRSPVTPSMPLLTDGDVHELVRELLASRPAAAAGSTQNAAAGSGLNLTNGDSGSGIGDSHNATVSLLGDGAAAVIRKIARRAVENQFIASGGGGSGGGRGTGTSSSAATTAAAGSARPVPMGRHPALAYPSNQQYQYAASGGGYGGYQDGGMMAMQPLDPRGAPPQAALQQYYQQHDASTSAQPFPFLLSQYHHSASGHSLHYVVPSGAAPLVQPGLKRAHSVHMLTVEDGRRLRVSGLTAHEMMWIFRPKLAGFSTVLRFIKTSIAQRRSRKLHAFGTILRFLKLRVQRRRAMKLYAMALARMFARQRLVERYQTRFAAVGLALAGLREKKSELVRKAASAAMAGKDKSMTISNPFGTGSSGQLKQQQQQQEKYDGPKMRGIHWESMTEDSVKGTIWDKSTHDALLKHTSSGRPASMNLGSDLDVRGLLPDLLTKFAADAPGAAKPVAAAAGGKGSAGGPSAAAAKPTAISVLASDVGRLLGISVGAVVGRRPLPEVKTAIMNLDTEALGGVEKVQLLANNTVLFDGEKLGPLAKYAGDPSLLVLPERFVKEVAMSTPGMRMRLNVMEFQAALPELYASCKSKLQLLLDSVCEIMHSRRLATLLLDVILPLGNKLNAGARSKIAAGFKVSSLNKLVQTRAATGETFLQFVVAGLLERQPALLELSKDFVHLQKATPAALSRDRVVIDLSRMEQGVRQVEALLGTCRTLKETTNIAKLEALLEHSVQVVAEVKGLQSEAVKSYEELARWLGEDASKTPAETLLGYMQSFIAAVAKDTKEVRDRMERVAKAEAKKRAIELQAAAAVAAAPAASAGARGRASPAQPRGATNGTGGGRARSKSRNRSPGPQSSSSAAVARGAGARSRSPPTASVRRQAAGSPPLSSSDHPAAMQSAAATAAAHLNDSSPSQLNSHHQPPVRGSFSPHALGQLQSPGLQSPPPPPHHPHPPAAAASITSHHYGLHDGAGGRANGGTMPGARSPVNSAGSMGSIAAAILAGGGCSVGSAHTSGRSSPAQSGLSTPGHSSSHRYTPSGSPASVLEQSGDVIGAALTEATRRWSGRQMAAAPPLPGRAGGIDAHVRSPSLADIAAELYTGTNPSPPPYPGR